MVDGQLQSPDVELVVARGRDGYGAIVDHSSGGQAPNDDSNSSSSGKGGSGDGRQREAGPEGPDKTKPPLSFLQGTTAAVGVLVLSGLLNLTAIVISFIEH